MLDTGEDRGIADLEAVEMQDWQHRAVGDRVEKLVGLPGRRQRPGLGLAVADDAGDNQGGIVERRAEGVAEGIAEFAAFVNGARRRGGHMARNTAGKRKLLEQPLHSGFVLADVGIDLAVAAFEVGVGDERRAAMARAGDVNHVEVVDLDRAIEVNVDEILPGRGSPVPHHQRLDVGQR